MAVPAAATAVGFYVQFGFDCCLKFRSGERETTSNIG